MAMDELRAALESNPNDTRTFQTFLEPVLREGDKEGFDEFLDAVLAAVEPGDSLANLMRAADFKAKSVGGEIAPYVTYRIGRVFLDVIGNEDMAEMYFRRLPPDSSYAQELGDFYVDFYCRKENWRKLEQLFQFRCRAEGEDNPAVEAKRLTARLAKEKGNAERALAYWQSLRKEIPDDPEVQQELIELYETTGKWHQVADLLKSQADSLPGEELEAKIELYGRLIPIYRDRLKMDAKVAATYQTILALQPDNPDAFEALCAHYSQTNRWPDLVKVLKASLDTDDEARRFELHRQIAEIMEDKFSNTTEAMKNYEAMLELSPDDLDVVRKLKSLYEQRRDWGNYVVVSQKEMESLEGEEKAAQLKELAKLALENVRDPAVGISLWRAVREDAPEDPEAFDAMMHLCERSKDFDGVAELLEERIGQVDDDDQQTLLERLATIYASRIGDIDQAAECWNRLLALDGENHRARAELKKILVRAKDLEALDTFFRTYGTLNDYQRSLDLMAKGEEEPLLKAQVLFRLASLYQETEGKEEKARTALEQVLEVDPQNVDAAEQLVTLYGKLEKWEELVGVQELLLSEKPEMATEERLVLFLSKAVVHEEKLGQKEEAFFTYVAAYQLDWTRTDVRAEMERLAELSGNWETFISVYEQTLELLDDEASKTPYLLRIAEIWEEKLDNSDSATDYYSQALAIDEGNMVALAALAVIYRRTEQFTDLKDTIEKQLEIETASDERRRLLEELGGVCLDQVQDSSGAIEAYNALIGEFPDFARAHDLLADVLLREGRDEELLQALESRVAALDLVGQALADTLVDIGMLYYAVHEEMLVACDRYIEALLVVPGYTRAVALLEEMVGNEEVQYRVARALEPVYEARGTIDRLADVLEIQLLWAQEHERTDLLTRLKGLYLTLEDDEAASVTVRRLLRLLPADASLKEELEEIAGRLGNWFPVVALYGEIVEEIGDTDFRHEVMRSAASIYHTRIEDVDLAKELYNRVLEEAPGDALSLAALQGISFQEEDWSGLLAIYETRKELEEESEGKMAVMFEIAHLCKDHLDDLELASATVEEIIGIDPTSMDALHLLDELYTAQEKWEDLIRALDQTCSLVSADEDRGELLLRMAELLERRLDDPTGMVEKLEQTLSLRPEDDRAIEILERNIEGEIALPVLDLLETYMRRVAKWERLVDLLYLRKSFVEDPLDQLLLQKEISRLYEEELGNTQAAFENYRVALALSPEDEDVLKHLLKLAESLANFEELFLVLDEETRQMEECPQQVEMWRIQAVMARDKMEDSRTAIDYFNRVLDREAEDLEAVESLAALYREAEMWQELVAVLERNAELASSVDEKKGLCMEIGAVWYGYLESPEKAIVAYEEILSLDHEDVTALSNLDNLYRETENWEELEQVLQRLSFRSDTGEERRELLLQRVEILDLHLERFDEANQVLTELYTENREDMEVVLRLEDLQEKREDWLTLLDILRHKLELLPAQEHFAVLMKLAMVQGENLSDIHESVATYRSLLEQFPDEEGPVDQLEQLVLAGDDKEQAYALLKPILEEKGEWERLLISMGALKEWLDGAERKLSLCLEMAAIAEDRMDDLHRAFYLAAEGLKTAPHRQDVIALLEKIGHKAQMLEQVVEAYSETAEEADNSDDSLNLMRRKANLLKDELQDFERAVEEFEALREMAPDREVLEALDDLYVLLERFDRLGEILREELELTPEMEEKLLYYYRLADITEENLDDPEAACEVLKEAYMLDMENEATLLRLRRLYDDKVGDPEAADLLEVFYSSHEQWEDVSAVLERRFALAEGSQDKLEIAQKLLSVFLNRLSDNARGLQYAGECLVLDPEDFASLDQVLRLKDETGLVEEAVGYLQLARFEADGVEAYRNLGMEAGRLLQGLEKYDEAEEVFKEVIGRDEEYIPAWQALEKLLEAQERLEDHERVLCRLVELEEYEDERIPLLLKLGRLRRDLMDNPEQAIEAFEQVVALDERREEALNSLASLYEMGELYDKLTGILKNMVELAREADERVELLSRLAQLYEDKLADVEKAVVAWHDVLDWSPSDEEVMANLERLFELQEDWPSYVEIAEREANLEHVSLDRKTELWRRIARIAGEHLDDTIVAQQNWARVATALPDDEEAAGNLRVLYRINEDFMNLATLLAKLASNEETEPEVRIDYWVELGQVKMDEVMEPDGAIAAWKEVRALDADRLDSYEALERLYMESARFEEAVALLQAKLELIEDPAQKVRLLDTIAETQEGSLNQWRAAADTRLRIIELTPADLEQYERVANLYESHEEWQPLADLLGHRLEVEDGEEQKVATLTWMAEIFEGHLENDSAALTAVKNALGIAEGELDLIDMGERIAMRSELWSDLYEIWAGAVTHLEDDRRLETMFKLGELLRDRLDNYQEAIEWFERVVETDEDSEKALAALVELYEAVENWEKLATVLELIAQVTSDFQKQLEFSLQLGEVSYSKLEDPARAQTAYRQVLELDPTEERAVNSLQALYSEMEDWENLIEVLTMRASLHPEEDAELKLLSGDLLEDKLEEPMKAADLYEELVAYDPTAREAFDRLERIYTEHEVWDRLVETYDRLLSVTTEDEKRVELLRKLALLSESVLENSDSAADYFQQILDLRPDDLETIAALERLYEEQDRFDDLVLVLRRTVQLADSVREKVSYLEKIAEISASRLDDLHSAIMAYKEILEHDPAHMQTLSRLEELFGEEGDWMEVLNVLDLRLKVARDVGESVGYYLRKGDIYKEELLMPDKAREQYHLALERIPDHEEVTLKLVLLYEEEENWEKIIDMLLTQARSVDSEEQRARIFGQMGSYMRDKMEDPDRAIEVYEAALERVPNLTEALIPLSEIYLEKKEWAKAFPLLDMQKQLMEDNASSEELADLFRRMGKACLNTGRKDEALEYYRQAYDKNSADLSTLEGLAELNLQQGNHEVAEAYYKKLLQAAEQDFDTTKLIGIYRALGDVEMNMGRPDTAREYLGKVLDLVPNDTGTLNGLVELMEYHSDWEGAIRYRRQLVDLISDEMEQWKMLIAIGDTYRERLDNLDLAIRAYNEALEAQPYSKSALVKLLEIHINAKAFAEAINILQHLVQVEDNAPRKANYTFTIATIYRTELSEPDMAVDYYEQTLDLSPEKLEAFRGVDELLTENRNWEELEGAYRRMIQRVRGKGMEKLEFMLYRGLGEIYRSRLKQPDMAASSYELAAKLKRDDSQVHEILAQLYELLDQKEKAVAEHRTLVLLEPDRIESYRKMAVIFRELGLEDDAWFALSVLAMANRLTDEEKEFYARKQPAGLIEPRRSLDANLWSKTVFSRAENVHVGEIFQTLYQSIGAHLEGRDRKELGLKKKDEVDLSQKTIFSTVFNRVSSLLGIPAPQVFLSDRSFGMRIEATVPPIIVIGKDMLHGKSEKELAFVVAKNLTYFHPMHILAACYPAPVLKLLYQVGLKFVNPDAPIEGMDSEQFQVLSQHLRKRISPQLATTLGNSINHFYRRQKRPGISKWLTGVELTANHAGLLSCMDLGVSANQLKQESIAFSKLPPKEKAKELVLYAISEEFAQAREATGLELPR